MDLTLLKLNETSPNLGNELTLNNHLLKHFTRMLKCDLEYLVEKTGPSIEKQNTVRINLPLFSTVIPFVENKDKLILTEIFPSVQKHDI